MLAVDIIKRANAARAAREADRDRVFRVCWELEELAPKLRFAFDPERQELVKRIKDLAAQL
jgi:hypothetical protein